MRASKEHARKADTPRRGRAASVTGLAALVTGLVGVAAPGTASADGSTARLDGASRFETAASIALAAFPQGAPRVYLARADTFPDALAAGALTEGPVLLVPQAGPVPQAVLTAVSTLAPASVVALGGAGAVSDGVVSAVAAGRPTSRLAGATRYETATAVAAAAFPGRAPVVYLARGDAFPDALAAGSLTDGPVLLVPTSGPPPAAVLQEVIRLDPTRVVALGGPTAVSEQVLQATAQGRSTGRLAGADRYSTAASISAAAHPAGASTVYLARADNFPDALAAGALRDGPVLLVPPCGELPGTVGAEIERLGASLVVALGSSAAVCDRTLTAAAARASAGSMYLSEASEVSGWFQDSGAASINGNVYARSVIDYVSSDSGRVEYDLGRSHSRFKATIGMTDDSDGRNASAQFDVFVDDRLVSSTQLAVGQSQDIDVDVTNGLRLRLEVTGLGTGYGGAAFGNARALRPGAPDDAAVFTTPRQPKPLLYLVDAQDVSGWFQDSGAAAVNGRTYARSIVDWVSQDSGRVEYDLGRAYGRFQATIGMTDDSDGGNASAQFDVFLDDRLLSSDQLAVGESRDLDLDVTDGLRLRLEVKGLGTGYGGAAFGDARLLP